MSVIRDIVAVALWQGHDPFMASAASQSDMPDCDAIGEPLESDVSLVEALPDPPPQIVIDVGGSDSSTTVRVARLFHERHHNGVVVSVDTWLGSWEQWCQRDGSSRLGLKSGWPILQQAFLHHVRAQGLHRYVVPLPLDHHNGVILLKLKRLFADVLHLDLRNACLSVEVLLKLWWPVLRDGGRLLATGLRRDQHAFLQARQTCEIFADEHGAVFQCADTIMRIDKPAQASVTSHSQTHVLTKMSGAEVPRTLEYEGEFGPELALFLPYVKWLSATGLLRSTRVVTYAGMRCFYEGLEYGELVEKHSLRQHVLEEHRLASLPVKSELTYNVTERSPFHLYPDLRQRFRLLPIASAFEGLSKPLLIIHNKFAVEWNRPPINHLGLELLDTLFGMLAREFTVVYIRHGMKPEPVGYSKDDNFTLPFDDRSVLNTHPDVMGFDDVYEDYVKNGGDQDVNTFKNVLFSRCHHFITSQGGGAVHMAFFSGSLMMVLHRYGREERLAYGNGFYGFVANPAPTRVICLNDDELLRGVRMFQGSWVMDGKVVVSQEHDPLLQELSPWTLERRRNGKWSR